MYMQPNRVVTPRRARVAPTVNIDSAVCYLNWTVKLLISWNLNNGVVAGLVPFQVMEKVYCVSSLDKSRLTTFFLLFFNEKRSNLIYIANFIRTIVRIESKECKNEGKYDLY